MCSRRPCRRSTDFRSEFNGFHLRSKENRKPSPLVSFGLPGPLSFQGRARDMVAARSGTNLDRESVRVRPPSAPDPPSGKRNACKDDAEKAKTQEIKGRPGRGASCISGIDGHAKPDQHGGRHRGLGRGAAWAFSRQAFLRRAFANDGYGIFVMTHRSIPPAML